MPRHTLPSMAWSLTIREWTVSSKIYGIRMPSMFLIGLGKIACRGRNAEAKGYCCCWSNQRNRGPIEEEQGTFLKGGNTCKAISSFWILNQLMNVFVKIRSIMSRDGLRLLAPTRSRSHSTMVALRSSTRRISSSPQGQK